MTALSRFDRNVILNDGVQTNVPFFAAISIASHADGLRGSSRVPVDCEHSLFFFIFSEGSARARERRAKRREARNEGSSHRRKGVAPSRTLSNARGHLRVSSVLLDGPRKKRDCS